EHAVSLLTRSSERHDREVVIRTRPGDRGRTTGNSVSRGAAEPQRAPACSCVHGWHQGRRGEPGARSRVLIRCTPNTPATWGARRSDNPPHHPERCPTW